MKANKNALAHTILLVVVCRLNVARLSVNRDNSQRARLSETKREFVVEALRTTADTNMGE